MSVAMAELIASQASQIMGAKYISVSALSCLVYDHLLHFDDELADVWLKFGRRPVLKSLFLLGRYNMMISVGCITISLGVFNTEWKLYVSLFRLLHASSDVEISRSGCQIWIIAANVFVGLGLIGTEGIVIYRLRSLWQFNRPITRVITAMVSVVFLTSIVCLSIEAMQLRHLYVPIQGLPGCLFTPSSPKPLAVSVVMGVTLVIWGVFNVCLFTFNTFATPYLCSSDILKRFRKDGGRYFLCLLVVHMLYLFSSIFGQNSRLSTIPLVTALTAILNVRIFHGIALETEKYADEYNVALPKVIS